MQMLTYLCQRQVSEETHLSDKQVCAYGVRVWIGGNI